jgi:hypothetical protein
MSRQTLSRVVRLERTRSEGRGRQILVAQDQSEAERLRVSYPEALLIITGVPRGTDLVTGR